MSTQAIGAARTTTTVRSRFLSQVLRFDAIASGGLGVLLLGASGVLDGVLGLPRGLSLSAGAFLLVWTAALLLIARRPELNRTAVSEVVIINLAWVVASIAAVFTVDLTGLGVAFVLVQAGAVALFAELQLTALRKTT
ncbi:hypothetical protein [Kribbella sp. NPDC023855]|uniref:hypothetical protein n=1 Tax=Kribbella sp. NPDC023855 TaxID=3154698 RepID=UPI0033F8B3A0